MVELPRKEQFQTTLEADVKTPTVAEAPVTGTPHRLQTPKSKTGRKIVKRTIIAAALLAGAAFVGDYRLPLLDDRPLHRIDRRRLCEGRLHHHRAEDLRLHRRGAGQRQRPRSRPARCWPASTTATIARPDPGQGRRQGRRGRHQQSRRPDRSAAIGHRPGQGHDRRHAGLADLRRSRLRTARRT